LIDKQLDSKSQRRVALAKKPLEMSIVETVLPSVEPVDSRNSNGAELPSQPRDGYHSKGVEIRIEPLDIPG
jgi:hypothetical protein